MSGVAKRPDLNELGEEVEKFLPVMVTVRLCVSQFTSISSILLLLTFIVDEHRIMNKIQKLRHQPNRLATSDHCVLEVQLGLPGSVYDKPPIP